MKRTLLTMVALSLVIGCYNENIYKDRFPNDWRNAIDHKAYVSISQVLLSNKIKDSKSVYLKEDINDKFILAFTDDQKTYRYYLLNLRPVEVKLVQDTNIQAPKDMWSKIADDLQNSISESEANIPSDPYEIIEGAFEGRPSKSEVQPMLEDVMKSHGIEITDENVNKAASALVSMRIMSKVGVTEMKILKHVYQNGSPHQKLPVDIAISATYLEKTK